MSAGVDLSIVIVNWNSREYLRKCIDSIHANTRTMRYEIVVIDAASFDGCGEMLRQSYPDVRFIQSDQNAGFARSNNQAFAASAGAAVLFLNPDTELVGAAVDTMYARLLALPRAGAIGCRLLNADGTLQTSCVQSFPTIANQLLNAEALRRRMPRSRLWGMAPLFAEGNEPREAEGISGACVMVTRTAFEAVGGFSEDYFMYAEDMDLCAKLRQSGYANYFVPDATVIHYGGSSSGQAVSTFAAVMMPEAIFRFFRKTRGSVYAQSYRIGMGICAVVRIALLLLLGLGRREPNVARLKWCAILRWSVGRHPIVKRHYMAISAVSTGTTGFGTPASSRSEGIRSAS